MPVPRTSSMVIPRRLRKDEACQLIMDAILDGTLSEGERIRDSELEVWFGVSRTPIRMALARLDELGLVETGPRRLTRVCRRSPGSLVELGRAIECVATVVVARLVTPGRGVPQGLVQALDRSLDACRGHRVGSADQVDVVEATRGLARWLVENAPGSLARQLVTRLEVQARFHAGVRCEHVDVAEVERVVEQVARSASSLTGTGVRA